jgi:predicted dehydrogenase
MRLTRRHFLKTSAAGSVAAGTIPASGQSGGTPTAASRVRIATIGFGGMRSGDTRYVLTVPGVELVAVSDIYDGRLARARELRGERIVTTRDYREILARPDVDAVIVATPDHWHARISMAIHG